MKNIISCLALVGLLLASGGTLRSASPTTQPEVVQVPIIMYHSLAGAGGSTSISGAAFEADLQYLQANDYQAVTLGALAGFVHHGTPLPERPVVLTFDDGYYNNYSVGLPLARAYQMPIVVSVIGKDTEIWSEISSTDLRHGHVTWDQIREMAASGFVEIANHTWDLHKQEHGRKGASIQQGEDLESYWAALHADLGKLQRELAVRAGVAPIGFVFPFGNTCPEAAEILAELGFLVSLSCCDGMNTLTRGDPSCLFDLRRYERTPGRPVGEILENV